MFVLNKANFYLFFLVLAVSFRKVQARTVRPPLNSLEASIWADTNFKKLKVDLMVAQIVEAQTRAELNRAQTRVANQSLNSSSGVRQETSPICQGCFDPDSIRDGLILPCAHLQTCLECAKHSQSLGQPCPVCRGPIQSVIKVFL